MDDNIKYINNVQLEDIKWQFLLSTYSTGETIKQILKDEIFTEDKNLNKKLYDIENEIEHQSTLWSVTPFALIFLGRNLAAVEKLLIENKDTFNYTKYHNVAEHLLEIFALIAELLKEEYDELLNPPELEIYNHIEDIFNNENVQKLADKNFSSKSEYLENLCEISISDEVLFNSIIYYTNLVIREFIPVIEKFSAMEDREIKEIADEVLDYLY